MLDRRIDRRMRLRRHGSVPLEKALRPGARFVVEIPVERYREAQPLRGLEPEAADIGEEHERRNERLPLLDQTEFRGLLDAVDQVGATVGQEHGLRAGRLSLQEIGAEVGSPHRVPNAAEYLAAGRLYDLPCVGFHGVP